MAIELRSNPLVGAWLMISLAAAVACGPSPDPDVTGTGQDAGPVADLADAEPAVAQATEMLQAVEQDRVTDIAALLDAGADPNGANELGETPLHWAAWDNRFEAARMLLDRGAEVTATTGIEGEEATPLHWAALRGSLAVAELLLDRGAKIDVRSNVDATPLHWAANGGQVAMAGWLIDQGASVDAVDQKGDTPADWAEEAGFDELADTLRRQAL